MVRTDETFDNEDLAMLTGSRAALRQNLASLGVTPVVNNVAQQIGIRICWESFEETAGDNAATLGDTPFFKHRSACGHYLRKIDKDAPQLGVGSQYRSKEKALAASHAEVRLTV